jgi:acetylornithine/succinyldiaminopimelate/putrescine aminotransferase
MGLEETRALEERYLMRTYKRGAVDFVRGEGCLLYDADGKEYLDFLAGISVCSLGHCHPAVVDAVADQARRLMHVSNLFYTEPMARLAQRLSESSLGGRVFFCNSGTEANEAAIKVARKHAHGRGIAAPEIVSFEGEFHGRSYGALSATPKLARNEALGPMLPGFRSVPDNDADALRAAVGPNTAAVLIEPIQGESGVWPTSDEALVAAREACDASGALLIFDEIQTGLGRTGSLWAYQQTPVRPDVITSARRSATACRSAPASPGRRPPTRCSRGTTARPSPPGRSAPAPRSRSSTRSTTRPCCGRCGSSEPACGAVWRSFRGSRGRVGGA